MLLLGSNPPGTRVAVWQAVTFLPEGKNVDVKGGVNMH
jgi:hypothetical protein